MKFSREEVFAKRKGEKEAHAGPLFTAAMYRKDYSTSIQIISTWPNIKNHRDLERNPPLHLAAACGNLELVRLSFSEDNLWSKSTQGFFSGRTPLYYATANHHLHVVE